MKSLTEWLERRKIKGKWQLDDRHILSYVKDDGTEEVELEAALAAAEEDGLVVTVASKQKNGVRVTSLAKLKGKWRVNENNQIEFEIEHKRADVGTGALTKNAVLTFTGTWHVGENHEIIYTYQTRSGKSRGTKRAELVFKGYWDILENNRLTYLIQGDSESAFRFRGAFQTQSILAKKGEIRYQLGAEVLSAPSIRRKKRVQTITLFGKFKLSKKLGFEFEMEYADGEKRSITLGAEYALREDLTIEAKLLNRAGDPLGFEVILTKDFPGLEAEAFVRLRKTLRENAVEAGVTIPW